MIGFARARAKSIFSKLSFTTVIKKEMKTHKQGNNEEIFIKKERSSKNFLEAIKIGGIWLS